MTFRQQKQAELERIIAAERQKSEKKINAEKRPFESVLAQHIAENKTKYQLRINAEEKSKNPAIAELEKKRKQIESLSDAYFQNLSSFFAGKEIEAITPCYYGSPSYHFFTFKTIDQIDKARKPKVPCREGLCSCGKLTYIKTNTQINKPVHCHCTIEYIKTLQNDYKQPSTKEIEPIQSQIDTLKKEKKAAIEVIENAYHENIRVIEKEHQLPDEVKEKISQETQVFKKTELLSEIFKAAEFKEQAIPDIIIIKTRPPAFNSGKGEDESENAEEQPGLPVLISKPAQTPTPQPSSDFKKSKKLLNEILKQAYRVHYDNSCLRRSGTPKAFKILKALACCIIEIEGIVDADDEVIYKKLKLACSPRNSEQKNNNNPMAIHHALKKPRRSVFACCGLFGSTRAEQVIEETIYEIDYPIKDCTNLRLEAVRSRHAFAYLPRYGRR